jgi:RDD family
MSDQTSNPQPPDDSTPHSQDPPEPGAVPPPASAQTRPVVGPAGLGPRFVARLLDFVLLAVANSLLVGALLAGAWLGSSTTGLGAWGFGTGASWAANALTTLASTAITLGYFVLMEHLTGQTVGKMVLRLETRGAAGGRPTVEEALRRNAWTAIGIIGVVPFLGWLGGVLSLVAVITIMVTINNDTASRQGWHDTFAGGTTVVQRG